VPSDVKLTSELSLTDAGPDMIFGTDRGML
jgi:hypothetical protein